MVTPATTSQPLTTVNTTTTLTKLKTICSLMYPSRDSSSNSRLQRLTTCPPISSNHRCLALFRWLQRHMKSLSKAKSMPSFLTSTLTALLSSLTQPTISTNQTCSSHSTRRLESLSRNHSLNVLPQLQQPLSEVQHLWAALCLRLRCASHLPCHLLLSLQRQSNKLQRTSVKLKKLHPLSLICRRSSRILTPNRLLLPLLPNRWLLSQKSL